MSTELRRSIFVVLTVLIISLPLITISCSPPSPATVRIGYLLGDIHQLPFFVAQEKGFFKEEAADVQVVGPFDAGPAEMDALAANQLDMGYVGVSPSILAAARKVDLSIIAGVNLEGSALAVAKNVGSITELKSRKVATPAPGSIQYILLAMALAGNKMSFGDIELFPGTIKPPDMPMSLQTGRIDGYFVWEPFVAKAVISGTGKILTESKDIWPGHPCCVVVTRNDFSSKNREAVAAVIRAHEKAVKFIADHSGEAGMIAQKWTKLDAPIIEAAMTRVKYTYTINKDDVKRFVKEIIALGVDGTIKPIITSGDVPDVDIFVNRVVDLKYWQR
jgi:NitT/TauT family transport system substrate-binding protein